jgi:hypothetical protein
MPKRKQVALFSVDGGQRKPEKCNNVRSSGECPSHSCFCQSAPAFVDVALAKVKAAKAFGGDMPSRGPLNEECVLRAICDDYISHSRSADELKPKQVRLREALRRVAVKLKMPYLSTFNCKTTSLRTLGRALWEGCNLAVVPKHKAQDLVETQKSDTQKVVDMFDQLVAKYKTPIADPEPPLPTLLDGKDRRHAQEHLKSMGIVLLRGFVPEETCEWLMSRVYNHRSKHSPTWLTETMSLGRRGCYFDKDWNLAPLRHIQERLVQSLGLSPTEIGVDNAKLPPNNSKSVLLAYTQGAENWAHQDDNKDFSFQALLMLSEPGLDFTGGALYVLDGSSGWEKRSVAFERRGDVAIFRSNGSFFHGMDEVLPGSGHECKRIAVGLFHKHQ